MAYNVSAFGSVMGNQTVTVWYVLNGGQDFGAQFAQGKPEGAATDGSSDGALVSFDHEIDLTVENGVITYKFQLRNLTGNLQSFMLCGGGLI